MDRGNPISWNVLAAGTPVLSSSGSQVGEVREVLGDENADIFDGLVVRLGRDDRFADASLVAAIHEHAVELTIDDEAAQRLPEPSANPAVVEVDPDDVAQPDQPVRDAARKAKDWLTGNY